MFNKNKKTETIVLNAGLEEKVYDLLRRVTVLENERDSIKNKFELIKGKGKIFKLENNAVIYCTVPRFFNTLNNVEVEVSEENLNASFELFSTNYILTLEKIDYEEEELYKIVKVEEVK